MTGESSVRKKCLTDIIQILETSPENEKKENLRKVKKVFQFKMTDSARIVVKQLKEILYSIEKETNVNSTFRTIVKKVLNKEKKQGDEKKNTELETSKLPDETKSARITSSKKHEDIRNKSGPGDSKLPDMTKTAKIATGKKPETTRKRQNIETCKPPDLSRLRSSCGGSPRMSREGRELARLRALRLGPEKDWCSASKFRFMEALGLGLRTR